MITLLNGSSAFLRRDGQYLLMRRAADLPIAPNMWSNVGGKMEPQELNDPYAACLREIEEETGITPGHIHELTLRYIITRRAGDIIRQNYVYFGRTDVERFVDSEEGTLHWIPAQELLAREYTKTFQAMLGHFVHSPDLQGRVVVGVAGKRGGEFCINWSAVEDFD